MPRQLVESRINQAAVPGAQGRLRVALTVLRGQEELVRQWGDRHALATCLGHRARMELARGDPEAAGAALDEQAPLLELTGDVELRVDHLAVRAVLLDRQGEHGAAVRRLAEALAEARAHGLLQRADTLQAVLDSGDLSPAVHGAPAHGAADKEAR